MNHGENFNREQVGLNYRPNEVTASIAWHGLQDLEQRNRRRQELAVALKHHMGQCLCPPETALKRGHAPSENHVYYVYPFLVHQNRHRFATRMKRMGIPVGEGYLTPPLHHYRAFKKYAKGPLPVVDELSFKTLCILSCLTPDKPLSFAEEVAEKMRKALE